MLCAFAQNMHETGVLSVHWTMLHLQLLLLLWPSPIIIPEWVTSIDLRLLRVLLVSILGLIGQSKCLGPLFFLCAVSWSGCSTCLDLFHLLSDNIEAAHFRLSYRYRIWNCFGIYQIRLLMVSVLGQCVCTHLWGVIWAVIRPGKSCLMHPSF